jgi:hypothetical protein
MRISRPLRDWSSWPMVPSTGSALYLRSHPVQLVCAEPYWAMIRSSLRDFALQTAVTTPGPERNAPSTGLCACDPALDQQSAAPRRAVGQSWDKCRSSSVRFKGRTLQDACGGWPPPHHPPDLELQTHSELQLAYVEREVAVIDARHLPVRSGVGSERVACPDCF